MTRSTRRPGSLGSGGGRASWRFHADNGPNTVGVNGERVSLSKIGTIVMCEAPRFEGSIRECTIKRDGGRWFACFAVRYVDARAEPSAERDAIGVDVGVKALATLLDGTACPNPRPLAGALRKLRRCDEAIAQSQGQSEPGPEAP